MDVTTEEISASEKKNIANDGEKPLKRRISFASQNETLEFRKNETISEMLPKVQPQNKDIIKLAEDDFCPNSKISTYKVDRQKNIIDRVEKNLRFIKENQSTKDFQLVDTILESSTGGCYTLRINYQHSAASENEVSRRNENYEDSYPGSPADLYEAYLKIQKSKLQNHKFTHKNAYAGEDKVKVPHLRENDRVNFYEDQRLEFSKPTVTEANLFYEIKVQLKGNNINWGIKTVSQTTSRDKRRKLIQLSMKSSI
ncbi:unnamed protein product [Ceratitis capitata]|uniref:(Mediterranean fruit fly) hypothetical protein n=1 Tax=Ceratitis capitata TaxID=7213 RepID=A0A811VL94_CERCA|nr:unnamed protein product [Ceratitis capitata]